MEACCITHLEKSGRALSLSRKENKKEGFHKFKMEKNDSNKVMVVENLARDP